MILVSAKSSNSLKQLTRYWRCNLKKPLGSSLVAITTKAEFQKFLDWCSKNTSSSRLQGIEENFNIRNEDLSLVSTSIFKYI